MKPLHKLRVAARVLRSEGVRSARDRLLDGWTEWARSRALSGDRVDLSSPPAAAARKSLRVDPPVLLYLATPPRPSLGGVQASLRAWLDEAAHDRGVALLYRVSPNRYRLEVTGPAGGRRVELATAGGAEALPDLDPAFESALPWALEATGAELLHLVGLHGVPLESLGRSVPVAVRTLISLHDFSPFCFRPHLLEHPGLAFCGYSLDLERCGRCVRWNLPMGSEDLARHREAAARALSGASALTFSSSFLRRAYRELFPGLDGVRSWVIPPAPVSGGGLAVEMPEARSGGRPLRHLAFVGSALPHKGVLVFEELLDELRGAALDGLRWSVFGGGDPQALRRLRRRPGVRVRGYYRAGSLPRLLIRERVDLALLLSIVPESYGLTLDECRQAGVPALAFALGAPGERIAEAGGGLTVPLASGARGLARILEEVRSGRLEPAPSEHPAETSPAGHERAWRAVYAHLLSGTEEGAPGERSPRPAPTLGSEEPT